MDMYNATLIGKRLRPMLSKPLIVELPNYQYKCLNYKRHWMKSMGKFYRQNLRCKINIILKCT
jgi:hypothetical protein